MPDSFYIITCSCALFQNQSYSELIMLNMAVFDSDIWIAKGITDYFSSPDVDAYNCHSLDELNQLMQEQNIKILIAELTTEKNNLMECVSFLKKLSRNYSELRLVVYTRLTDPALIKFLLQYLPRCKLVLKRDPILTLAVNLFSHSDQRHSALLAEEWRAIAAQEETLTPREFAMLGQFAGGHSYKIIARNIDLSTKTISYYKQRIMNKLGCQNIAELRRRMHNIGLLKHQFVLQEQTSCAK